MSIDTQDRQKDSKMVEFVSIGSDKCKNRQTDNPI